MANHVAQLVLRKIEARAILNGRHSREVHRVHAGQIAPGGHAADGCGVIIADADGDGAAGKLTHQLGKELAGKHNLTGLLHLGRQYSLNRQTAVRTQQRNTVFICIQ